MNIFKTMAVKDPEAVTRAIPVIDFGPAFRGEPGGLEAVARQVRRASEEIGFFYLAGHGVPDAVVDAAFAASREFHALPDGVKQALAINENNIGYLAPNQASGRVHRHRPPGRTTTRASSSATTAGPSIPPS
jgi:isopenicillin N synthase-like dioxygenase